MNTLAVILLFLILLAVAWPLAIIFGAGVLVWWVLSDWVRDPAGNLLLLGFAYFMLGLWLGFDQVNDFISGWWHSPGWSR